YCGTTDAPPLPSAKILYGDRLPARAPASWPGWPDPATEATASVPQQGDAGGPVPALSDRRANVSPAPDGPTAAPSEDTASPASAAPSRPRKRAATRNRASKPKAARAHFTRIHSTRFRRATWRTVVTEPQASTGYPITFPPPP